MRTVYPIVTSWDSRTLLAHVLPDLNLLARRVREESFHTWSTLELEVYPDTPE